MSEINFFKFIPEKIDAALLQNKFSERLLRHNVESHEAVAAELFKDLRSNQASSGAHSICPFPLISSVKNCYNHAKKIKKAIKDEQGLSLGRCQMILAETYGYKGWGGFINAIYLYYGEEELIQRKRRAKKIQRILTKQGHFVKLKAIYNELECISTTK